MPHSAYPPPPVPKNHLAQEPTPGSAVKFSHHFFYQGSGFFMFLVDVGQLFMLCTKSVPIPTPKDTTNGTICQTDVGDVFDSDDSSDSDGAGDGASANDQCVDIIWAKAARGVWGLAHVFNNKLFFTRDIMDDDAVPMHFNVPDPKPKPKPKPAPKASVAPKPGPKGQHRQEFRMVYHRKKGFTSQPVEQ